MELIIQHMSLVTASIGLLAFLVTVIVQVIKGISFIKKFPTNLVVIILSLVLAVVGFFVYLSMNAIPFVWYYIPTAIIGGFLVAYIAMFGWDKFNDLWIKFKATE